MQPERASETSRRRAAQASPHEPVAADLHGGPQIAASDLDRHVLQVEQRLQDYVESRLEIHGPFAQAKAKPGLLRRLFNVWVRFRPEIYFILGVLFASALFALQTPLEWIGDLITRWIIR